MNPSEDTLTAGTLIDGARMYAAAADAVNDQLPNALHVLSHLLGTSIELALKAYLRYSGYTENQLRKISHDLRKLLEHAERNGLAQTGSRRFVLAVAGHNYRERLFVYPEEGVMNIIIPGRLRQMAHELITDIFIEIKGEDAYQQLKSAPGLSILSQYPDDIDSSDWAHLFPRHSNTQAIPEGR